MLRIGGRALPLRDEVLVEGTRLDGFSVDQQATAADGRTETCDTLDDIQQEGRSKTLPFVALVWWTLDELLLRERVRWPVAAALAAALAQGAIGGAGLDVYEAEPVVHPALLTAPNAVLLPHLGSGSEETRVAMGLCAVENLTAYFADRPLPNPV